MKSYSGAITYGGEEIVYEVLFVRRKTLEMAVHPDLRVIIKAPQGIDIPEIEKRIKQRARWIKRQLDYFRQFSPRMPPRRYIGGESHLYLGRQYRLKLIEDGGNSIKLSKGYFWINCKDQGDITKIKSMLEAWYTEKAREKFAESFEHCWPDFERLKLPRPKLQVRRMKTRWGSLSKSGTLTLNLSLIQAPRECIDYVITHELCHLKHHDHSPAFYKQLEKVMPDWERRKHKLEQALA